MTRNFSSRLTNLTRDAQFGTLLRRLIGAGFSRVVTGMTFDLDAVLEEFGFAAEGC